MHFPTVSAFLLMTILTTTDVPAQSDGQRSIGKRGADGTAGRAQVQDRTNQAPGGKEALMQTAMKRETHSYARPEEAVVTHLDLTLDINLDKKRLKGTAVYDVKAKKGGTLVLDIKGLSVSSVTDGEGNPLKYKIQDADPVLGSPLVILLADETKRVSIHYSTTDNSDGLQWLTPAQNDGKTPFMYSQGQSILSRTWFPTQDSPAVRFTYNATVTVPDGMVALMSALNNPTEPRGERVFKFTQPLAVPAYLIAIAVGDIHFKETGPRTGVYALRHVLEDAAKEFSDLEKMLSAAEELCGPYEWKRFDVLVMPPSFPFGGMENPMLTFATPTVIAGDRSLVSLIAHELLHSWSGNLVTCARWADLWLNEGWTVHLERRLVETLYGKGLAETMEVLGLQDLRQTITEMGDKNRDTGLNPDLSGRDPDDAMTDVAYERGALAIKAIEQAWGRPAFDRFAEHYFKSFRFRSIHAEEFIVFTEKYAKDSGLTAVPLRDMVEAIGQVKDGDRTRVADLMQVEKARVAFLTGRNLADHGVEKWNAQQRQYFLRILKEPLTYEQLETLDKVLGLSTSRNAEVNFEWFLLCIRNGHEAVKPQLEAFLSTVGRRKFVLPIYQELFARNEWQEWGNGLYERNRPSYHSITSGSVDRLRMK
jgi:leukotriene-A4 hydrolase